MSVAAAFAQALPGISPDVYAPADFRAVSALVHAEAGIVLAEGKAMLVYSRLAPLVRDSGCATFSAYLETLRADRAERMKAVRALTTNHTFFYREAHHFEHLAAAVRPGMVRRLESGGRFRIWSAGCSSGEETWSVLMTLLGPDARAGADLARRDLRLLASDIATHALAKAETACYPAADLDPVPAELRRAWTQTTGDTARISPTLAGIARFRELNLQGPWPMTGPFDIIFCRNVMIYFDNPTKERLVARFAEALAPGGYLYIGHSERVTGPAEALLTVAGPTIYRRRNP